MITCTSGKKMDEVVDVLRHRERRSPTLAQRRQKRSSHTAEAVQ